MKVWLVTTGEPLPGEGGSRLWRTGMLAEILASRGHTVVWWTSTFDHSSGRQRAAADTVLRVSERYHIRLLRSPGYTSNMSVGRVVDHAVMARRFTQAVAGLLLPDVVLCSLPTLDLAVAASRYGRTVRVPTVLDVRDLWPDLHLDLLPRRLRGIGRAFLAPMRWQGRRACRQATAITGVTRSFVDWGVRHAGRASTEFDEPFAMGYPAHDDTNQEKARAEAFWRELRVPGDPDELVVCFFGTLGHLFEIEPVVEAAARLRSRGQKYRFVICGRGEQLARYRALAGDNGGILFPGWVDGAQVRALMRLSTVGLAPYVRTPNFLLNIPNKPIEYLSAGLPVLTTLDGELGTLLRAHDCGVTYPSRDVDGLVQTLCDLTASPERLRVMRKNALRLYKSAFTAELVYGDMAGYLERVAVEFGALR